MLNRSQRFTENILRERKNDFASAFDKGRIQSQIGHSRHDPEFAYQINVPLDDPTGIGDEIAAADLVSGIEVISRRKLARSRKPKLAHRRCEQFQRKRLH